jgi:hypothetical protein
MAQYAYKTRLSEHIAETPEGYLACTRCILCRSGTQQYHKSELGLSGDGLVAVYRPPEEVLDPTFIASIVGKAVTLDHPGSGFLNAMSHSWSAKGTVLNARRGEDDEDGNVTVIGDLMITDPKAIERVKSGLRQLSLGYQYELEQGSHGLEMRGLRCNHAAIVAVGRAGNAQIVDAYDGPLEALNAPENTDPDQVQDEIESEEAMTDKQLAKMIADALAAHPTMARMSKLCDQLEKSMKSVQTLPKNERGSNPVAGDPDDTDEADLVPVEALSESERGSNPVLDGLRELKPHIQASGNRKAIDAFNTAMRAAKRGNVGPGTRLIQDLAGYDPRFEAGSFQDAIDARREQMLNNEPRQGRESSAKRRAADREPRAESYQDMMARVRRERLK